MKTFGIKIKFDGTAEEAAAKYQPALLTSFPAGTWAEFEIDLIPEFDSARNMAVDIYSFEESFAQSIAVALEVFKNADPLLIE